MWSSFQLTSKQKQHLVTVEQLEQVVKEKEIEELKQNDNQFVAAIKTLESLGYTYHGGEMWKPPVGEKPSYIDKCEEYVQIDFTKEDLFDLKDDLEAGNLFYKLYHTQKNPEWVCVDNVAKLTKVYASNYEIFRKVALSERDVFVKEALKLVQPLDTYKSVIEKMYDSGLFYLK